MSWPAVALGEVADINPRGPGRGELAPSVEVDFVPMASVSEGGEMTVSERRTYEEVSKGFTAFRPSDVLLAKITPCFENNKIAKSKVSTKYAFGSTEFHVLRGKPEALDPDYLTYFLRQDHIRKAGERRMTGSGGQRRVPKTFLEELKIPLPPLEEQKRIAGILDQAAELCRLRTHALDKLSTLGQAIFYEMFGASDGGIREWPTATLGELVADAQIGAVRGANEMSDEKACEYLRMDAIGTDGSLNLNDLRCVDASDHDLEKYGLRRGDLLFNTRNSKELVGKTAVLRQDFSGIYNNNILRCRFVLPSYADFFDAYLRTATGSRSLENIKSGTTSVFAVYQKALMSLRVPVPDESLTNEFASKLMASHAFKSEYERGIGFSESLFASLQHRAFRGEL